jgi:prepilin-type N-terminal cleavage/methylation domain-containing protein/prepilin-type processing-associated H-X9-DG protein
MSRTNRSARGFTLIELLVVIAIIAILAAILFPVFAQARDKARSSACLSNAKQQALAFHMYAQDYDETTVMAYFGDWSPCCADRGGHYPWPKQLAPYVKNKGVYTCPSLASANWDTLKDAYGKGEQYDFPSVIGYGLNPNVAARSMAVVDKPAETIAICETRYYSPGHPSYNAAWGWYGAYPSNSAVDPGAPIKGQTYSHSLTANRHSEGNNIAFADGHAKWMRWDVITDPAKVGLWNGRGL